MEKLNRISWLGHPEYVKFLKAYIPGHTEEEIRTAFEKKYGYRLTEGQIGNFKYKHRVRSGTKGGQFVKGQSPHNKGKKMPPEVYKKIRHTMFKKGSVPPQYRPVGSERIDKDGYTVVKVADPNVWVLKQRVVYEQKTGIKPKKNEVVIFLDGNRQNFDIDNLYLLTRGALARYCQDGLYCNDRQISRAAAGIAALKDITGKIKAGRDQ